MTKPKSKLARQCSFSLAGKARWFAAAISWRCWRQPDQRCSTAHEPQ